MAEQRGISAFFAPVSPLTRSRSVQQGFRDAAAAAVAEAAKPPKRGRGRPLSQPPPAKRALESQASAASAAKKIQLSNCLINIIPQHELQSNGLINIIPQHELQSNGLMNTYSN